MQISKDLFLSILAMDAYNRGYGAGIQVDASNVGFAAADSLPDNVDIANWIDDGFYAISYTITDDGVDGLDVGTQVLSFRGTDYYNNPDDPFLQRVRDGTADLFQGWSLGGERAGFCVIS